MAAPQQADLFSIPLLDGDAGRGQIVEVNDERAFALISLSKADQTGAIALDTVISLRAIPLAPFHSGQWTITGFDMIPKTRKLMMHDEAWLTMDLTEPAIIEAFLSACHGLFPWDGFPDVELFDRMLPPGRTRPANAVFGV